MDIFNFNINSNPYEVKIHSISGRNASVEVNGVKYDVDMKDDFDVDMSSSVPVQKPVVQKSQVQPAQKVQEQKKAPETVQKQQAPAQKAGGAKTIVSPMPGQVFKVLVAEGDSIKSGDIVVTIEAMKMENQIRSTMDGTVTKVHVKEGDVLAEGAPLVSL